MAENEVQNPLATETTSFDYRGTTDFESRTPEAPRDHSTVKKPIGKDPVLVQGLADIFGGVRETLAKGRGDSVLAEFQNRQLTIVDALETGDIKTSREARLRLRRNLMEFNTNYPQYAQDLANAHSKIIGFSDVVDVGREEERRTTALIDDLVDQGMLPPDHTQAQAEAAIAHNQSRQSRIRMIEDRQKELSVLLSQENLSAAERRRLESEEQDVWRDFVQYEAPDQVKQMRNNFERILKSDISEADKQAQIADLMIGFRSSEEIVQLRRVLGGEESEAFFKPFEMLEETYLQRARGELKDDEVERRLQRVENYNASILAADPGVQKIIGAKKLFGDTAILQMVASNPTLMKGVYEAMASNTTDTKANPFDASKYDSLEHMMDKLPDVLKEVDGDETLTGEVKEQVDGIIQGAADNEGSIRRDPIKARSLVEKLASTKWYEGVVKTGIVDQELASEAREALKLHYNDEVMGMVKRMFQEADIVSPEFQDLTSDDPERMQRALNSGGNLNDTEPLPDAVTYEINDNIIEFRAIDPNNAAAVKEARALNKDLAPIIRNMVKADAHLSGHNRYKETFQGYADQMLNPDFLGGEGGQNGGDEYAGGDAGDDLNLDDFAFPTISGDSLPEEVANDSEFMDEVERVADKNGFDPSVMLAVMDFETGGTFNPAQKNAAGSSGTGLIQFMAKTAKSLGTNVQELAKMSRKDQMKYVDKYFSQFDLEGKSPSDVYMSVLFPKAIGKSDDYVLFRKGTKAYSQNKGLDRNGSGTVTKAEAARKVVSLVGKYK